MDSKKHRLEEYLKEINAIPVISAEEEKELAKKIQEEGDDKSKERLVASTKRLVVAIADKYKDYNSDLPLMDIIEEGNRGLYAAAEKYDYKKEYKFSTYATWWIRRAIHKKLGIEGED